MRRPRPQTATTYTWAATDADGDKAELAFTIEVEGVPAVTLATADSAIAENGGTTTVNRHVEPCVESGDDGHGDPGRGKLHGGTGRGE